MDSDTRGRATILKSANKAITADLLDFWTQTVGKSSTLQLECAINQHPFGHERAGKSYLEFLISDNAGPLYTKQRSRGTRWFISFFLQMRASEKANRNRIFLLDEPGANLHEKAQGDVLKLLEKISTSVGIIYSTHSPHLLDERAFYRVLAVERDSKQPLHPTIVIGAHALGAASSDTLSPILTAMGANLSRQTTIKRHNNVILEELSSHYYIRAFWILKNCSQEANFLPATGTSNVSTFANLFLGWGLDFIVVVDDEPSGRSVYNNLKRDLFLDSQKWAARRMFKIPGCEGVEDVFHADDYKNWVIRKPSIVLGQSNAKWAKANGAAKAMHALGFLQAVEREEIKFGTLHPETQDRISNLVDAIATRLSTYSDPIELN